METEIVEKILGGRYSFRKGVFRVEDVPVTEAADAHGTPAYLYSRNHLIDRAAAVRRAFAAADPLVCYSVKANSNLAILRLFREEGLGADVVSEGELRRAGAAGFRADSIVFAGVGKTAAELDEAVGRGILSFNVENEGELAAIEAIGRRRRRKVSCSLRVNLDIDVDTHHYVKTARKENKFGLPMETAGRLIRGRKRLRYAVVDGIHFHLGSTIKEPGPYVEAIGKTARFCRETAFQPATLDIGGGFGVAYAPGDRVADIADFGAAICPAVARLGVRRFILEPGRFMVANAGVLLTRIVYVKENGEKTFYIVDAAMNDLVRPAFYGSHHSIFPAVRRRGTPAAADVVGPICESGDYFAKDRAFSRRLRPGEILVVASAGAYGFSMSSNYNSRRRPCELLADGASCRVIRKREAFSDLWKGEG